MNGDDIKKILGDSVRDIRLARGLTQEQLAERIGKQLNAVNRIEAGMNFAKSDTLAGLADALQVPPSVLLTPRPQFLLKEHQDYVGLINQLLLTFPAEKVREAYNILSVLNR